MQHTWAPIVSRRASCVKALQKTTIMTEKPLWGSEWEQDKKCHWQQLQEGRQSCKADSGLDKHTNTHTHVPPLTHSQQIVTDCTRTVLFTLHWISKMCHSPKQIVVKTKAAEMEMSICPMTKQLPPLSVSDICCTACVKGGFLSNILSVWHARISPFLSLLYLSIWGSLALSLAPSPSSVQTSTHSRFLHITLPRALPLKKV